MPDFFADDDLDEDGQSISPAESRTVSPDQLKRQKIRATQSLVSYMAFVWGHPSLVFLEIAWRWLFGVPFLMVAWTQAQLILARIPPSSVGLDKLEFQNPWLTSELLAEAIASYEPAIGEVLKWLLPVGVIGWAIVSGLGRTLVLARMNSIAPISDGPERSAATYLHKLPAYIVLQALWMLALLGCLWLWFRSVGWASATHITIGAQPDLVGYLCWLIFLSLGIYVVWALLSWALAIAPVLLFLEDGVHSPWAALRRSFSLGKTLSGKLMEVSLVLAIVKIMLIVLDMVFSAAPLPFADQFGPDALHVLYVFVFIVFLIANDYFYVIRLRSFIELWRHDQVPSSGVGGFVSDKRVRRYSYLQAEFFEKVFDGEYQEIWISDESSLWDFATGRTLEPYWDKIREFYGVDASDTERALLWKIFKRIANRQ